jgi:hypothetical protein
MSDSSTLMEHLKNILPTPATWLVTSSTLGITIPIAALPGYLKEVWPELHIPEVLLFQVALISTTLFFGAFVLILLLLRHIKNNQLPEENIRESMVRAIHYLSYYEGGVIESTLFNELKQQPTIHSLSNTTACIMISDHQLFH